MAELKAMDRDLHPESKHLSVTTRAFCVGIAVTFLVNLLPAYSAYIVHSSRMVFAHLPMATMVVFTVLAWPLNVLVARVKPQWALSRGEMVVVFSMGWIAGAVPAANFMGLFIGGIAAPYYYASPENQWGDYLLDGLPKWAAPPNDANQMTYFFEGKPPGVDIPWDAWMTPLVWWGVFLIALALVSVALMAVLRRQWVDRERLPFPLAEAPLTMLDEVEAGKIQASAFSLVLGWRDHSRGCGGVEYRGLFLAHISTYSVDGQMGVAYWARVSECYDQIEFFCAGVRVFYQSRCVVQFVVFLRAGYCANRCF